MNIILCLVPSEQAIHVVGLQYLDGVFFISVKADGTRWWLRNHMESGKVKTIVLIKIKEEAGTLLMQPHTK